MSARTTAVRLLVKPLVNKLAEVTGVNVDDDIRDVLAMPFADA